METYNSVEIGIPTMGIGTVSLPELGDLEPTADITPLEAVRITQMLVIAATNRSFIRIDCLAFVLEHGLARHFSKVRPDEPKPDVEPDVELDRQPPPR